jgi:hypothetical protein
MAKIASFWPNHKIFNGFVARSELKKKCTEILRKDQFNENHSKDLYPKRNVTKKA